MSRESGLNTFRDKDGLWEGRNVMDICSDTAWSKQSKIVLDFYNDRRCDVLAAKPNAAHAAIAALEEHHEVTVVTQNFDNLHEVAGSSKVIHLHGLITKARTQACLTELYDCTGNIHIGDTIMVDGEALQLRPHVVFFGEDLYDFEEAMEASKEAKAMLIVGTTLEVTPANRIAIETKAHDVWVVDPNPPSQKLLKNWHRTVRYIRMEATTGVPLATAAINAFAEHSRPIREAVVGEAR